MAPPIESPDPRRDEVLAAAIWESLSRISEVGERARFEALFRAAAGAIRALREIDLSSYERPEVGSADLSIWEQLAPVIGETIVHVNELLTVVREQLPDEAASVTDDFDFELAFAEESSPAQAPATSSDDPLAGIRAAHATIRAIASNLSREVTSFGNDIRKPAVMADRWNLLDALQAFRGKSRTAIGELIYLATSAFGEVRKDAVIPGYAEEIADAVDLRAAVTQLGAEVSRANVELQRLDGPALRERAIELLVALAGFTQARAYTLLRGADKRALLVARDGLEAQLAKAAPEPLALRHEVEGLDRFFESLTVINRRETLVLHDRACLAQTAAELMQVEAQLRDRSIDRARHALFQAARTARALYGRDREFDAYLAAMDKLAIDALDLPELNAEFEGFRSQLATLRV